jgi:hypothetical protein
MKILTRVSLMACVVLGITAGAGEPAKDIPATRAEVKKAVEDLRTQSPSLIAPGEVSYLETTQTVESSPAKLLAEDSFRVLSKYESERSYSFLVRHHNVQYINGREYRTVEDRETRIEKKQPAIMNLWAAPASGSGNYFNLAKSESSLPTPEAVLKRTNCGGLKNCPKELVTQMVDYDYEDFDSYGRWIRLHYTYSGSSEVPYMSSPIKACVTGPFYVNGYELKATRCTAVTDFNPGN